MFPVKLIILIALVVSMNTVGATAEFMQGRIVTDGSSAEGVMFDAVSGNYIVVYKTYDAYGSDMLYEIIYEPATKIVPSISVDYESMEYGTGQPVKDGVSVNDIFYRYSISNSSKLQSIYKIIFYTLADIVDGSESSATGWRFVYNKRYKGADVRLIGWSDRQDRQAAGNRENRFSLISNALPGYGEVRISGRTPIYAPAGEGPQGDVGKAFDAIRQNDYVSVYTAIPLIRVKKAAPEDALLELANHLEVLASRGDIEPVQYQKLRGLLVAGHAAYKRNRKGAARQLLSDARAYLYAIKQRGAPVVSDLLYGILVFDLKYLEKIL